MPESRGPVLPLLLAHHRELSRAPMPVGARHRIAARIAQEGTRRSVLGWRRRWLPMATFAAGAALVLLVLGWNAMRSSPATHVDRGDAQAVLAGYALQGDGCDGRKAGDAAVLSGRCHAVSAQMSVETWDDTEVDLSARSVTVRRGEAMFDVAKVGPGETPIRVVVSHGVIEVLGTRFTVDQGDGGGTVDLFEGHIRFHDVDSARPSVDVFPGDRYAWGDRIPAVSVQTHASAVLELPKPPTIAVEVAAESPAPVRSPLPSAASLIERVAKLRAAGSYAEAAYALRRALRRQWETRTAEVLSFELGEVLERHLHDAEAACVHWRRHDRKYTQGRYAGAVAKALRACP